MHVDPGYVPECPGDAALFLDPGELEQEVGVEEVAPELAVGDRFQAEPFLPLDQFGDRFVLDRAQVFVGNVVGGARAPRSRSADAGTSRHGRRAKAALWSSGILSCQCCCKARVLTRARARLTGDS